jgi:inorganic pyrophosphatase
MLDEDRQDDKLVAVHVDDPAFADYTAMAQLPQHVERQLRRFFEDYKALEQKTVVVDDFFGTEDAAEVLGEAIELYASQLQHLRGEA